MHRKSLRVAVPGERFFVVLVLGCQPTWTADGRLTGALGRRVSRAREAFAGLDNGLFIVSGGRLWGGVVEADAMRDELVRRGVDASSVLRERCSLTTRDNARLSAQVLRRFPDPVPGVTLVTCEWHMPRAAALFRREGLSVAPVPAPSPPVFPVKRWVRAGREWVSGLRVAGA